MVSLSPGITEILYRLGAAPLVVGVSDLCPAPPQGSLPRLGTLLRPDLAQVADLRPDLVLIVPQPDLEHRLLQMKLTAEVVQIDSFTQLIDAYRKVGQRVGLEDASRKLERETLDRIAGLKRALEGTPKKRVLLVLGPHPRWVAGPASMFHDMLRFAQGENAATRAEAKLYRLDEAELRAARPDVIVAVIDGGGDRRAAERERQFWRRFRDVPAAGGDRVVVLDEKLYLMVGPLAVDGAQLLARTLHPRRFQ